MSYILPALWMGVILYFSVIPCEYQSLAIPYLDKIAHFFEYFVLSVLLWLSGGAGALFTLILGGGYGILIELIQGLLPYRDASVADAVFNFFGLAAGIALRRLILVLWRR